MALLVQITDVLVYTTSEDDPEYRAIVAALTGAGIPFGLMMYADPSQHQAVFDSLSTWSWGNEYAKKILTKFPFVTWNQHDDDWEKHPMISESAVELTSSKLIEKPEIVKIRDGFVPHTPKPITVKEEDVRIDP